MKQFLLFLLVLAGPAAFAQGHVVRGQVVDRQNGGLPSASVVLLQPRDSSVVTNTLSDAQGLFSLKEVREGKYIFKVTFVGYAPHFHNITTPAGTDTLDLGIIELQPVAIQLEEVQVKGARDVVVKEDTVEYNADSFRTRPNASLEQLLKRLPGVEVGPDGNVRVQGEVVTRIFVDGKEFFGSDLKTATKNLPADAISKVQAIDGKSEEARFSGIDDGQRQKVINVTLKEERRNMGFGKAAAGVGTNNRYAVQGNYFRFGKGSQVSVLGSSNNTNNQGLISEEVSAGDGQDGLVTLHTGGLNVFKQLSPKTSVRGSYLINYNKSTLVSDITRQNFLPEGTALYYEDNRQQNNSDGNFATAVLEHTDSINTLRVNTVFNFMDALTTGSSNRQSYSVVDTLVNEGERNADTRNSNANLNATLFYGHRFGKKGRLFTVTTQFASYQNQTRGQSQSFTRFSGGEDEDVQQRNEQQSDNVNYSTRLSFTEPLGKKQYLQAHYQVSNQSAKSNLEVFDIADDVVLRNEEQSSRFGLGYLYQQAGLTYQLNRPKYQLAFGSDLQHAALSRNLQTSEGAEGQVKRKFRNILPNARFNWRFNRRTRLDLVYNTSVREPAINQIQPVVSRYDPLSLYVGNPDLRPEYTHQSKLNFSTTAAKSGVFFSSSFTLNYNTNPITPAVIIDERQVRTTRYINVRQSHSAGAFLSLSLPVKKLNSRFNVSPYLRHGQSVNLLNGVAGTINQRSLGGTVGYMYQYKEYLDVNLRANIAATRSAYSLNTNQNQTLGTSAFEAEVTVYFLKHYSLLSELYYNKFVNRSTGFNQVVPICNFSLSRSVLKNDRGQLKMSAFNVLNRNAGASQFTELNYIEQSTQNVLGNFYMLSFSYNITKGQSE